MVISEQSYNAKAEPALFCSLIDLLGAEGIVLSAVHSAFVSDTVLNLAVNHGSVNPGCAATP